MQYNLRPDEIISNDSELPIPRNTKVWNVYERYCLPVETEVEEYFRNATGQIVMCLANGNRYFADTAVGKTVFLDFVEANDVSANVKS